MFPREVLQPHEGVGEQKDGIKSRGERHCRANEEDLGGAQMRIGRKNEVHSRGEKNTDERQQVGRGDDSTFVLARGAMLD